MYPTGQRRVESFWRIKTMRVSILSPILFLSLIFAALADDKTADGPDDAFRRFMLALVKNDADGIKAVILPANDADVLCKGDPIPQEIEQQVEISIRGIKLTPIHEGEKVLLPGGKEFNVEKGAINDHKILVWAEMDNQRMPTPFWLEKKPDGWKVDARPLIEARKAALKQIQQDNKH
jgi:hypothetical protein